MFSHFDWRQFISSFVVLFAVIDILGSVPIILSLQKRGKKISATKVAVLSFVMFIGFFYVGEAFLRLFRLDLSSFAIAGSFIILIMALEMILDVSIFGDGPDTPQDANFVPLVFPLIAGAGVLTTLLSIRSQYEDVNILLAIVANVAVVFGVVRLARLIARKVKPEYIYIMQKFFGIVLLAIAVQLFISNITRLIADISKAAS